MWFKNLSLFRLTETFTISSTELVEKLEHMIFRPCGSHDESSFGWTAPLGGNSELLIHEANGFIMICAKKEEKVLPSAVINEIVQEKVLELETSQGSKLSRKEKNTLKDEIIFELLPRAFSFSRRTYAYIDPKGGWVVVDSASTKKAEDLLSHLRKCLGSLPLVPINTVNNPSQVMTQWLMDDETPQGITIEDECELRSTEEEGGIVRCKNHDLSLPEIKNHLQQQKLVTKLALNWDNRISFVLDEALAIKRLRLLDLIQEQIEDTNAETEAERFDADFSIMTLELANFLPRLLEVFGGEMKN
ncbi:MAG: recombination-associated protein RdgC [Methylococcales bacterium]|nr:recombination-associated protein RdgC [Methylococcales bacterium]MCK5926240.1 recombination-associated protein RdgC [Methylococcales bacterium]